MPVKVIMACIHAALAIMLLLSAAIGFLSAAGKTADSELRELTLELGLTAEQGIKVAEILDVTGKQAQHDREMNAGNPAALIEAARRRRASQDEWIEKILEEWQRERMQHYKMERKRAEEFFMLREGLLLAPEQCEQAEFIIRLYNGRIEELRGKGGAPTGGAGVSGPPPESGRRGAGDMMPPAGGPSEEIKSLQSGKEKEIRAILNAQQRKLYKSILKIIREERRQRPENMRSPDGKQRPLAEEQGKSAGGNNFSGI